MYFERFFLLHFFFVGSLFEKKKPRGIFDNNLKHLSLNAKIENGHISVVFCVPPCSRLQNFKSKQVINIECKTNRLWLSLALSFILMLSMFVFPESSLFKIIY